MSIWSSFTWPTLALGIVALLGVILSVSLSPALAQSPPGQVSSVTLTRADGTVTADWPAVSGATRYHVTYSTDGGASWHAPVDDHRNIPANSLTFNADNAKTYVVGVRAGNDGGWGPWRNSPSAGPYTPPTPTPAPEPPSQPPGQVSSVTLTRADGTVTADWPAVSGAIRYHVTYSTDGGASWHAPVDDHWNIPANSLTFTTDNAKTYTVGVRAGNDDGWGPWRNSPSAGPYTPPPPPTPTPTPTPAPVPALTAERNEDGDTASISWTAYSGDEFEYYRVIVCDDSQYDGFSCDGTVFTSDPIYDVGDVGPLTVAELDPNIGYGVILQVWRGGGALKIHATLPAPTLTVENITATSMTVRVSNLGGPWSYSMQERAGAASEATRAQAQIESGNVVNCVGPIQGAAGDIEDLAPGTTYDLTAYRDGSCQSAFVTRSTSTLAPRLVITDTGSKPGQSHTISIRNWKHRDWMGNLQQSPWWLEETYDNTISCVKVTGEQYPHTVSTPGSGFVYRQYMAYSKAGCNDRDGARDLIASGYFKRLAPQYLTKHNVSANYAELQIHGFTGNWSLGRTNPDGSRWCKVGYSHRHPAKLRNLTPGTKYIYTAFRYFSCGWGSKIAAITFTTNGLGVSDITSRGATLTIGGHSGNWWYTADTGPDSTTCRDGGATTNNTDTEALTGLSPNTEYTYRAYSDSSCLNEVADGTVTFSTYEMTANSITATTATLTLVGHTGNWWLKRTVPGGDNTCHAKTASTHSLTTLDAGTSYTYKAYDKTNCNSADEIASETFSTLASLDASSVTADSATLTLDGHTGNWWLKRTSPADTNCVSKGMTYTHSLSSLDAGTWYTYRAYDKANCQDADEIASETFTTAASLDASSITADSATLTLDGHTGNWWLKRTSPADTNCVSKGMTYTHSLTSLDAGTQYTYRAYDKANCQDADEIASETFTTAASLDASSITADSATLTLDGHTGNWWLKRTSPADTNCVSKGMTYTHSLTSLDAGTQYTYKAYDKANCQDADEITSETFTTAASLDASSVTSDSATLTLDGHTGNWWLKRTTPADTNCVSKSMTYTHSLTTLDAGTSYTYRAYDKANCNSADEIASETFTTAASLTASSVTSDSATLTLDGHTGNWWLKRTAPGGDNTCHAKTTSTHSLTTLDAGTSYTYRAYDKANCQDADEIASETFTTAASLDASSVTADSATLTLDGHTGNWWLKRTTPADTNCVSKGMTYTHSLTTLDAGTSYTYKAYDKANCDSADEIASEMFTTAASLDASSVTADSATLTLDGHTGNWWLKRTAPGGDNTCHAKTTSTHSLTTLDAGTSYTYRAYDKANCNSADEIASETFTTAASLDASSVTSDSATLTLDGHTGNWWLKRTAPGGDNTCHAKTTSTHSLTTLDAGTSYTYRAYDKANCNSADEIASETFTTAASLDASSVTSDSATLTLDGHTGNWWLKRTAPTGDNTCHAKTTSTHSLTTLDAGTSYTYRAYDKANCNSADEIASETFTTAASLDASSITSDSATLTLVGHTGNWWLKRTVPGGDNTCHAKTASTHSLTTLDAGTSYTYKAYDKTNCNSADEIASETFSTLASLDASSVTADSATLTLDGHTGNWWLKRTTPADTNCVSKGMTYTHSLSSLDAGTSYTYRAYDKANCQDADEIASETFTTAASLDASSVTSDSATLTLDGHTGNWWLKRTSPADTNCVSKGMTYTHSLTSLDAGTSYTYKAYDKTNCNSADEIASETFTTAASLDASSVTATSTTLTLDGHTGNWWLKRTAPGGDNTCHAKTTSTHSLTTLDAGTQYTYKAYDKANCNSADEIASETFSTLASLDVSSVTTISATLTVAAPASNWWLKRTAPTGDNTCHAKTAATHSLTTLMASTTYSYVAYDKANCNSADEIANETFTTPDYGDLRAAEGFGDALSDAGNDDPADIWSNGTTMWVLDTVDKKIYAYKMSDKSRDSSKDFDTLDAAGNDDPAGIWSDGTTMWVTDTGDDKFYAYKMSDKSRDSSKDFNINSSNEDSTGIWSDGETMFVPDSADDRIYRYDITQNVKYLSGFWTPTGQVTVYEYVPDLNRTEAFVFNNNNPAGIWSDGATTWVTDTDGPPIFAYKASDNTRYADRDIIPRLHDDDDHGHDFPGYGGIWSDGSTMWVSKDDEDHTTLDAYYAFPALAAGSITATTATLTLSNFGGDWWYQGSQSNAPCTKVAAGTNTASLSNLTAGTPYTYKAYDKANCNSADEIAMRTFTTTSS